MAEKLTPDQVRRVGMLARIELTDSEVATLSDQLSEILDYVEQLNELNTDDVEPLSHPLPLRNVLREDQVGAMLSNDDALAAAPQRDSEYFKVPKVLDDGDA